MGHSSFFITKGTVDLYIFVFHIYDKKNVKNTGKITGEVKLFGEEVTVTINKTLTLLPKIGK